MFRSASTHTVVSCLVFSVCLVSPRIAEGQATDLCDLPQSEQGALLSEASLRMIARVCDPTLEFAQSPPSQSIPAPYFGVGASNVQVNTNVEDPVALALPATTQSEPSMAVHNGMIVAGWNDTSHEAQGTIVGYGVSFDGGESWLDRGALLPVAPFSVFNGGDPWIRVHEKTGNFYFVTLAMPVANIMNTRVDVYTGATPGVFPDWPGVMDATPAQPGVQDKPAMDVDNSGGPFDGRVYVCWRQFGGNANMKLSINQTVGVDQALQHVGVVNLTNPGSFLEQGCFVDVDQSNGDVYVAWEVHLPHPTTRTIVVRRSTDGGATFGPPTVAASMLTIGHTTTCAESRCAGRQVLDGDIRVVEFISSMTFNETTSNLHIVYAGDGDGTGGPDESDVFHVRCSPTGMNGVGQCTAPKKMNDDGTQTDQWHPYINAGPGGQLVAFWYDRRNDPTNNLIDVYRSYSTDDGITWMPNERVTDVSWGVPPLCPNFDTEASACYMAEYNHVTSDEENFYFIWGDNRNILNQRADPDVFFDKQPVPPIDARISSSKKGSLLLYSKVEVKWSEDGSTLLQDTFLDISNDFAGSVFVQGYFINGDMPLEALCDAQPCTPGNIIQAAEPGWNTADCRFELTANQPHYWSAAEGSMKCQSFVVLDDEGPGRPDPETGGTTRVLRGYALFYAVDFNPEPAVGDTGAWEEILWNHLHGDAVVVNYAEGSAWEYNAWAFQARAASHGMPLPTPGILRLDGIEYDAPYSTLLMDFYGVGSTALSSEGELATVHTDLTVHPVGADLRQDGCGPVMTKVESEIWNENESKFSGTRRCICCWDQTMLSDWARTDFVPNHFWRSALKTDKGKARLEGVASLECDYSTICGLDAYEVLGRPECEGATAGANGFGRLASKDAALLGLTTKFITFGAGAGMRHDSSGLNLTGSGAQTAVIQLDVATGPAQARDGSQRGSYDRSIGRSRAGK